MKLYQLQYNEFFSLDGEEFQKVRGDGMYCWCQDAEGKTHQFYMGEEVIKVKGF